MDLTAAARVAPAPSVVLTAAVRVAVVHSAAVTAVVDTAAPSVAAHTATVAVVDTVAVDIAVVAAAEWVDADRSKHQFPHFRIRHPRNLAH